MTARRPAAPADAGFALVELLITIAIMGIAFTAILAALGTSVLSSEHHRTSADANAALTSAAETVKGAAFTSCPTAVTTYRDYVRANTPLPGEWATSDIDIQSVICPTSAVQMVTLSATGPGSGTARTLTVAKSERPSSLPIPTTTTTAPPGPPPASSCRVIDARAFRFGSTVLVVAIASSNQPTCAWPLRARMSESTGSSSLVHFGWVWLGLVPAGSECNDGTCAITIVDGTNKAVITRPVVL